VNAVTLDLSQMASAAGSSSSAGSPMWPIRDVAKSYRRISETVPMYPARAAMPGRVAVWRRAHRISDWSHARKIRPSYAEDTPSQ
jgi:hypothetical protein